MKTYLVTLKDGSDYRIKATSPKNAISGVKQGKGRHQGTHFKTFRKDKAVLLTETI